MRTRVIALIAAVVVAVGSIAFRASPAYLKLKVAVELMGWDGLFVVARETIATRMLGLKQTQSRKTYHTLLDTLSQVDAEYCIPPRRVVTETEIAECHRLISHLVSTGFRVFYETDIDAPHFEPMVGPRMKALGDNPDAIYFNAIFNPEKDFIVRGSIRGEVYLSFTVYEADCIGCFSQKVVADINNFQMKVDESGAYEMVVSMKEKPANSKVANWLSLASLSKGKYPQLITRHYYENEKCAQLDFDLPKQNLTIVPLENRQATTPASSDSTNAERMERVIRFVKSHTIEMLQDPSKAPSWFSFTPNVFGPAVLFRNEVQGLGAVDIVYSAGPFVIKDPETQGVLVEAFMPKANFVNLVLWNKLLQTLAYENNRVVSLNRRQMKRSKLNPATLRGPVKILIAKHRPKNLPEDIEYMDSEGRMEGSMFWRFLLPDEEVQTPTAKLVKLDELR